MDEVPALQELHETTPPAAPTNANRANSNSNGTKLYSNPNSKSESESKQNRHQQQKPKERPKENQNPNQSSSVQPPNRQLAAGTRHKLVRTAEVSGHTSAHNNNNEGDAVAAVMGGGFATPPPPELIQLQAANGSSTSSQSPNSPGRQKAAASPMVDRREEISATAITSYKSQQQPQSQSQLQSQQQATSKTDKKQLKSTKKSETAAPKESKFADKLRRSFRRGEHKSLELKRPERVEIAPGPQSPQDPKQYPAVPVRGLLQQQQLRGATGGSGGGGGGGQTSQSQSIFSLSNLPGLGGGGGGGSGGGHINPALLLDSPEEATPPEYAYQHLSSVATTNSSTSLESNFGDFGEHTSSQSSISYWAWQQSNSSMGGEVSTTSSNSNVGSTTGTGLGSSGGGGGGGGAGSAGGGEHASERHGRPQSQTQLHAQPHHSHHSQQSQPSQQQQQHHPRPAAPGESTTAAAGGGGGSQPVAPAASSRSCSITSESSSTKLTRLQNFLFKSSNESSRSIQGHSNEAFTLSSHNSSSGEWENLGASGSASVSAGASSAPAAPEFCVGSFPEETNSEAGFSTIAESAEPTAADAHKYYQYTLTSPNNPFLPEITARSYSDGDDDNDNDDDEASQQRRAHTPAQHSQQQHQQQHHLHQQHHAHLLPEDELDANVTCVKYGGGGGGSRSAQLPTPSYSRAGSQESTHSEGGGGGGGGRSLHVLHAHPACPASPSSSSSTPGRQKRKLFSLNSPTRLLHHQQINSSHHHHPPSSAPAPSPAASSSTPDAIARATSVVSSAASAGSSFVRSLNPFLPGAGGGGGGAAGSSSKRAPLKQAAVTSPIAVPPDLNAKREEFLRATMKICLVVSPPTSKLQLKSKSLTHLDGLDSMVACQHGAAAVAKTSTSNTTPALPQTKTVLALTRPPPPQAKPAPFAPSTHHASVGVTPAPPHVIVAHKSSQGPGTPVAAQRFARQRPPTIYTEAPQQMLLAGATCSVAGAVVSSPLALALSPTSTLTYTATMTTLCCNNCICCLAGTRTSASSVVAGMPGGNSSGGGVGVGATSHPMPAQFQSYGAVQHTLSPAVVAGHTCTTPTAGGSGALGIGTTPTSHKKKSSFMQRKKPLLTRSEVSSSEYFSVSFCTENGCQDEEFIPATKGVTLSAALNQALRRRNLSFSQITITDNNPPPPSFLDAGTSPLANSLDEHTEVENLVGHHLVVTERDGSRKMLQKAASFGSRARPPRLLSSASTEETSESAVTGKHLKQRWSGLFGMKNPQHSQLCELLNNYAKNGVPQRITALNFDHPDLENALEYLDNMHKSWRDIVPSDAMSESETRIQTAIWELVTTEVYYIHALKTVTDLFLACLEAVQEERLLTDIDQHRLFSNVRDICEANLRFWTHFLYPMVAHTVATHEPLSISFFQMGFVAFAAIMAPYKKYCAEQSTCQFYCKELNRSNALFTSYLAWCESQKMCNRLRLADILVRPMQRLTKYGLLLYAIKKHMSDVSEIEAVDSMIQNVENFVFSVNNHLTTRQENERLKGVMARIESYDVVDTNNEQLDKLIKQYSQMFDLCAPMKGCPAHQVRHLFMEGDHKFKDNLGKADVHCFLLTDMLLVCKTIAKKGLGALKVIRQPYLTDRLVVQHSNNVLNCVYLNEFQVAVTAFTLQCSEAKNWYDSLQRACAIYAKLKQGSSHWGDSFRFGGSGASGGTAESLGVKKSPMNSSICSHMSSANNSHSGSVEWNDSRNISVDCEKTNSLSSDEGSSMMGAHALKGKNLLPSPHKLKVTANVAVPATANTLSVQPLNHLGQSLPNLNLHHSHTNNTLLVPGTTTSHSGNLLLSPSHRGISYPPPSPTRVPLRRGMAFSTSTKNPPLVKTRNITSQNSINWHHTPATPTPTPTSPQVQHNLVARAAAAAAPATTTANSNTGADGSPSTQTLPSSLTLHANVDVTAGVETNIQLSSSQLQCADLGTRNETDV